MLAFRHVVLAAASRRRSSESRALPGGPSPSKKNIAGGPNVQLSAAGLHVAAATVVVAADGVLQLLELDRARSLASPVTAPEWGPRRGRTRAHRSAARSGGAGCVQSVSSSAEKFRTQVTPRWGARSA